MHFDTPAFRHVLGVAPDVPLATWYDLLGVPADADRQAVEQAVFARMVQVRKYQVGAYQEQALALLSELGQAYVSLTDPESRAQYDASLKPADEHIAATEAAVEAQPADRTSCPKCGKPMAATSAVCLHCGFKRRSPTSQAASREPAPSPAAAFNMPLSELMRQDLTPEQIMARLRLMGEVYRAQKNGAAVWFPPKFCDFCHRPLPARADAHGLSGTALARLPAYVSFFAKRLEAQGRDRFTWPLEQEDRQRVGKAIAGGDASHMRLFCRRCTERLLSSTEKES